MGKNGRWMSHDPEVQSGRTTLQDAEIVISYDLAWTPDTIIQRAGRVLRFWREPRLVSLYIFVGDFQEDREGSRATTGVENRLRKLTARSEQAQQFSELPVFPEGDDLTYRTLGSLSRVTIEDLGLADITEIEEFTGVSGYLRHITETLIASFLIPFTRVGLRKLVKKDCHLRENFRFESL